MHAPAPTVNAILRALREPLAALAIVCVVANLALPASAFAGGSPVGASLCWGTGIPADDDGEGGGSRGTSCCLSAVMAVFTAGASALSVPAAPGRVTARPPADPVVPWAPRRSQPIRGPPLA